MLSELIERLNRLAFPEEMPGDLVKRIANRAVVCTFTHNNFILKKGAVCKGAHFLVKGLARSYYEVGNRQITSRLMEEDFIITSWLSFYRQQPSTEFIVAMEDCETVFIHFDDINALYREFPVFNVIGRRQVEYSFCQSELRTQMLRGLSSEERYKFFCENHPTLAGRVPLKYIASYLGMSDETLSRIRSSYKRRRSRIS